MKKFIISAATLIASVVVCSANETVSKPVGWGDVPFVKYPTTQMVFYGSGIDLNRNWNICIGNTDGGVEVHLTQQILPIQNCPGEYVVVRTYTTPDGKLIKRSLRRLSDYGSVPV